MGSWLYTPMTRIWGLRPWGHCASTEARSSNEPGEVRETFKAKEGCRGASGDTRKKRVPCGAARTWTRSWGGRAAPGNKRGPQSEAGGTPVEPGGLSQKQERTPSHPRAWRRLSQKHDPSLTEPGDASIRSRGGDPRVGLAWRGCRSRVEGTGQAPAHAPPPVSGMPYHLSLGPGIWIGGSGRPGLTPRVGCLWRPPPAPVWGSCGPGRPCAPPQLLLVRDPPGLPTPGAPLAVGEVSPGSHSTAETGPATGQQAPSPSNPVHVLQFY